mmetsp:Transcript_24804/g.45489  ORF Transcript_24804/g.45489 Transcript_24804/m.45489 type:complete len:459 (-) Transcript_24804:127-1503(-)
MAAPQKGTTVAEDDEENKLVNSVQSAAGHGPYISNVSPNASPSLHPQASPGIDGEFELTEQDRSGGAPKGRMPRSDEPAYVFPATPSPYLTASFPTCATSVPPLGADMVGFTECDIGFTQYEVGEAGYTEGTGYSEEMGSSLFDSAGMGVDGQFWGAQGSFENMDGSFDTANITPQQIAEWASAASLYGWQFDPSMLNGAAMEGEGEGVDHDGMLEAQGRSSRKDQDGKKKDKKRGKELSKEYNQWGENSNNGQWGDSASTEGTTTATPETSASIEGEPSQNLSNKATKEDWELEKDENGKPVNFTTVMLRNIPNKYTREMLIDQLSKDFRGEFDFLYLPIDFKNKCNVGYGFINFRTVENCAKFVSMFDGVDVRECLPGLNSKKVAEVTPARVQGFTENVRRLRNSPVMNQLIGHPEWMPVLFNEQGEGEDFPQPDTPLPPMKPRGRGRLAHIKGLD